MEIDPIDQMVIMDALRQFAEGCRYRAEAHREYGSTVVAQTRDVMASTAERALSRYEIHLPDRQLACVPLASRAGERSLAGMSAAANFAMASRQIMTHLVRGAFEEVFGDWGGQLVVVTWKGA